MNIFKKIISPQILRACIILFCTTIFLSACGDTTTECKAITEIEYQEMGVANGDCIAYKAAMQRDCWQADLLDIMYIAMGDIVIDAYKNLTKGAMNVVMVLFCVWFAFAILKHTSSLKEERASTFWTDVLKQFFLCYICGYLASSSESLIYVLNNFIYPVFNAFLELASELLLEADKHGQIEGVTFFGDEYTATQNTCQVSEQLREQISSSGFPSGANQMMQCLVCNALEKLDIGYSLGYTVMSVGFFVPKLIGLTILIVFTFVKLGFVYYFVETIFRFAMMVVLLPIFIMGFAFKQTRGWLSTGIKMILSGAAYMLAIAVVVSLSVVAIIEIIAKNKALFDAPFYEFAEFSPILFTLLMISFLIKKGMAVASKVANIITGAKITSKFQEALTGAIKVAAAALVVILTAGKAGVIMAKFEKIKRIKMVIDKVNENTQKAKAKLKQLAGKNDED